jgi:metal-responsive CopG/Arc/MetJ family transcriptional regulator
MSVEQFRQLVREEVEIALCKYLQENRDIEQIKAAVSKNMSEYIQRNSKIVSKDSFVTTEFSKHEIIVSGKPIGTITAVNSEGLNKKFAALEARVKKRLDYLEDKIKP